MVVPLAHGVGECGEALVLKLVADGQHLVDEQDVGPGLLMAVANARRTYMPEE